METLGELRSEAALDVVVHAKIALDDIGEVTDNLVGVLVEEALELGHFLVVVEIFLVLSVELDKNALEVLQGLDQLLSAPLLGQVGSLLELVVLLLQAVVELG